MFYELSANTFVFNLICSVMSVSELRQHDPLVIPVVFAFYLHCVPITNM